MALGRTTEAVEAATAAEALAPRDAYSLDTIAVVFTKAGLHERAVPLYKQAATSTNAPGYHYNLAAALQFLGRMDEARASYRACLARDPAHPLAWSGLVQITRQTPEANDIPALERAFAARANNPEAVHILGHALAKTNEDLGDYPRAMNWLAKAKAVRRFDPAAEDALFAAAERSASAFCPEGHTSARPIFIVGMPRTGTTLLERILSSHSEVSTAGELNDFASSLCRATGNAADRLYHPAVIDAAARADPKAIGEAYVASVSATLGLAGRFVDKQPLNVFLAPLILRALPDARIICLRRHPADAVLSTYRQAFAGSARIYDYTFDLEGAARHYLKFDRLVRRLAETLPADRFCEVSYEAIVSDLEGQVRRVLEFCDLPFEPACLDFHENAAPVATASAAQVRQPLYATSVGRWKRYRPMLDPALAVLLAGGCIDPAEAPGLAAP
ncbi:MAG: sulfotransferase family protein [Alphaproteobacteria bacterium]|nr:sulfotransferase family protein [Alphaproteobacteria bacterium]